jgi:diacylglycerol O-acyltransferase / wax synthase
MAKCKYDRLSAPDRFFLVVENANLHMHAGGVNIYEAGPLRTPEGGINIQLYKRAIESVLHRVPRYRQRLAWIPIENQPVWVDDPDFNLDYHIHHTALPRPGSEQQLKQLASRILAQQLDRSRPLWEIWVVEGLQDNRVAAINKIHHCMFDGISGMDLTQILFSPKPDYEIQEAPPYVPHSTPSGWELWRDAIGRRASLPFEIVRGAWVFGRQTEDLRGELTVRARALADLIGYATQPAQETPLNAAVGPRRRVDWLEMPLSQIKAVSKTCDCTVNDVVLATVAGAVREFLMARHVHPEDTGFRVLTPVNVRRPEERGRLENRVSNWFVDLPIGEANPRKRLDILKKTTAQLKSSRQALGVEMMEPVLEWAPTMLLSLSMRAMSSLTNMIVSNIPGPQIPLYVLGARVLDFYPILPLAANQGLEVAIISYAGKMCWGFSADYELVPDLRNFVKMIEASFAELAQAVGAQDLEHKPAEAGERKAIELRASRNGGRSKHKHPSAPSSQPPAPREGPEAAMPTPLSATSAASE